MRKLIVLAFAIVAVALVGRLSAADEKKDEKGKETTKSGVLIDNMCGMKMAAKDDPETAAKAHPKACAMKEGCAKSGYGVIVGKDLIKFDDNGNKLAKEYLAKEDNKLEVDVKGSEKEDGTFAVTAIDAKKS
jgi:hypothetical protein